MPSRRLLLAAAMGLVLTLIIGVTSLGDRPKADTQLKPAPAQLTAEQTLEVGMHIKNIYNHSLKDKTFKAEGWFWLKWPEAVQQLISSNAIALTELVELVNQVEGYDSTLELDSNAPIALSGGRYLQVYRFSSIFYDDQQNLRNFPFETLELPISLETRPSQFSMGSEAIVLKPVLKPGELLGESVSLNGYSVSGASTSTAIHTYTTSFGEELEQGAGDYSMVTFEVRYRTNGWAAFYRYVLPWLAVMMILLIAPNLDSQLNDLRLAIPSTALLTLVFLQEGAHADLPALDYLTYLDKLYLFGYLAATAQFCLFVWSTNLISRCGDAVQKQTIQRIERVDLVYQLTTLTGGLVLLLLAIARF